MTGVDRVASVGALRCDETGIASSLDGESNVQARFQALIENSTDVISVIDVDGTILYESPSIERILGYNGSELVGRNAYDYIHPDDLSGCEDALAMIAAGGTATLRLRFRHGDGSWVPVESRGRCLLDNPHVRGIVFNTRDVSERVELEERLHHADRLEALGRLAAGAAHDFNNSLMAIGGLAELAASEVASRPEQARAHLDAIRSCVENSRSLTAQMLTFSRKQALKPQRINLQPLLDSTKELLARTIGRAITVTTDSAPDLWDVFVDPAQMEQVLMNLALNARDALPDGGRIAIDAQNIEITATDERAGFDAKPGRYVQLLVCDNGVGMDEKTRARLFEPYFTTKPAGSGTGLGLALVHSVVAQSGGHVSVATTSGSGTTFEVLLPRARSKTVPRGPAFAHARPHEPATAAMRRDRHAAG